MIWGEPQRSVWQLLVFVSGSTRHVFVESPLINQKLSVKPALGSQSSPDTLNRQTEAETAETPS